MDKKNLLLIVPTLMCGGQERVAARTAEIMKHHYQVHLIVFSMEAAAFHPDCRIVDIHVPAENGGVRKFINIVKRCRIVRRYKKINDIHYSYSFGTSANLINVLSKHHDKILVSIRGSISAFEKNIKNYIIFSKSDSIICVSKRMKDNLLKKGISQDKLKVLYNPYEVGEIKRKAEESAEKNIPYKSIICVGRLNKYKGYHNLLKAMQIVVKRNKDTQLYFIGDGEELSSLKEMGSNLGIDQNLNFVGFQDNPYKYMNRGKILVLPSVSEGFPNVILEALSCGCAVISTDCETGPREILSRGGSHLNADKVEFANFGILTPAFQSDNAGEDDKISQLAEAISVVLNDEDVFLSYTKKADKRAMEFSYENYRNELIKIIENN